MLRLRDMHNVAVLCTLAVIRKRLRARQGEERVEFASPSRSRSQSQSGQSTSSGRGSHARPSTSAATTTSTSSQNEQPRKATPTGLQALGDDMLIWDGFVYKLLKKKSTTNSVWMCIGPRDCKGRVKVKNGAVAVVEMHSHDPESPNLQDYVPRWCGRLPRASDDDASEPAVDAFSESDLALLHSSSNKKRSVTKQFQCSECDMTFAIFRVLETHRMLEHQVSAQWRCQECGMQFLHEASHDIHVAENHSLKPFSCSVPGCLGRFETSEELAGHKDQHQEEMGLVGVPPGEKPRFKCTHCTAEYSQRCRLKIHMRQHTGEKPYHCQFCPRSFASSSHRTMHTKQSHLRIRKHLCNWCGMKFFNTSQLNMHIRTHTGEKPFSCPVCFRAFSRKTAMRVHLRQHTGAKPFVCDKCGQSFTVGVSLRTHLKSKHNIIVDVSQYKRKEESGDGIPTIGRPKTKVVGKQPGRVEYHCGNAQEM